MAAGHRDVGLRDDLHAHDGIEHVVRAATAAAVIGTGHQTQGRRRVLCISLHGHIVMYNWFPRSVTSR